jgi:diguanylate cyclase (GGDEF)-like protein
VSDVSDQPRERPSRDWIDLAMKAACALLVGVAVWWIAWMYLDGTDPALRRGHHWFRSVVVPAWILGAACLVALRHERYWSSPTQRALRLLPEIREGKAAIESLSQVKGGIERVMPLVQELLHEIRRKELEIVELNHEIGQRLANRTDALERKLDSLREQAARDPLTGLYNRRSLDALASRMLDEARLAGEDLGVLMIDVDHFKPLNDTLGHAAGDALLRDIGRLIRSSLGARDVAIRYGGDEFLVLLPDSGRDATQALARRLGSLVDALVKPLRARRPPRLSIGTAQLAELGHASAQELIGAADRSLYDVKHARRAG